jgi:hypothetical protein
MLVPFSATFAMHGPPQRFAYLSVCTMAFSLWALSQYEATATLGRGVTVFGEAREGRCLASL